MFYSLWVALTFSLGVAAKSSQPHTTTKVYWSSFFWLCLALLVFRTLTWEPLKTSGQSMSPTLSNNTLVFVNKSIYGWNFGIFETQNWKKYPRYNDIIAFHDVEKNNLIIKRVHAKYGDTVELRPTGWFINNQYLAPLSNKSYRWLDHHGTGYFDTKVRHEEKKSNAQFQWNTKRKVSFDVPYGFVFVLGDNLNQSRDSRDFGFVPVDFILGRVYEAPSFLNSKEK